MILFISFAVLVSLFLNGYYFNYIDSNVYLVYLNKIYNPSLYFHDYLFNQGHSNYSLFNYLIVSVKKYSGLNYQWLFLLLFLISLFLLYLSIYKLTFKLTNNHTVAILAVTFFILPKWMASVGNFTHARFFIYRDLAFALAIFCLIPLLERKMILSLVLIFCVTIVNPTVAPPLFIFWFFLLPLKTKKILLVIGLFLLMPALIIYFAKTGIQMFDAQWFRIMQERGKYSFPLLWKYTGWLNLLLYLFLLFISLFMSSKKIFGKYRKEIVSFILICLSIFSFHLIISSAVPIAYLIQFQLLRSLGYVCLFSLIAFAVFCSASIKKYPIATAVMIFFVYFWGDHLTLWHFLAAFGFFILILFKPKIRKLKITISDSRIYLLVIAIIFFHFLYTLAVKKPQIYLPYYLATPTFYEHFDSKSYWQWMEVQKWAANNTPEDSVFLTPPYLEGFRVMSERSVVGESKDGSVIFYSSEYAKEWKRRNELLNPFFTDNFNKIANLQEILPYNYLVAEKPNNCPEMKKVFENSLFVVCKAN